MPVVAQLGVEFPGHLPTPRWDLAGFALPGACSEFPPVCSQEAEVLCCSWLDPSFAQMPGV